MYRAYVGVRILRFGVQGYIGVIGFEALLQEWIGALHLSQFFPLMCFVGNETMNPISGPHILCRYTLNHKFSTVLPKHQGIAKP